MKDVTTITVIFIFFALAVWFVMSRTVIGRHLHAMGGNEQAAKLSGIRTDRLKWFAYMLGAVSASMVGIIYFAGSRFCQARQSRSRLRTQRNRRLSHRWLLAAGRSRHDTRHRSRLSIPADRDRCCQ